MHPQLVAMCTSSAGAVWHKGCRTLLAVKHADLEVHAMHATVRGLLSKDESLTRTFSDCRQSGTSCRAGVNYVISRAHQPPRSLECISVH
jgi:hypothetical protein